VITLSAIDRAQAFRYAGMPTVPDGHLSTLADTCEKRLLSAISPRYCERVYPLSRTPEGILCTGTSLLLTGRDIAAHLAGCSCALLFCATLSQGADFAIRAAQAEDVTAGLLTDAMASAAVEHVCDMAEAEMLAKLPEFHATWRFSAGYGDLPLQIQGDFLAAVDAPRRVGVCVSESGLLVPRKSVTAIIGLSKEPVERHKKGCTSCNAAETCPYRAKGAHCK
jgi:5-methyltetrahydrofolate--homocysteine methyltransferase